MFANGAADGRLRIKICGITNAADARAAIAFGADALGINCYRGSKRWIDIEAAADWLMEMPSAVNKVAILVNPTWEEVAAIAAWPFIDAVQLHGSETPAFCAQVAAAGIRFAKALVATDASTIAAAPLFSTDFVVLDSARGAEFGGTGVTFRWEIARHVASAHPELRVVVAGGLDAGNVAEAVRLARPFGVDVTSGVESSAGRKDHEKMRAFIDAAHSAA